VGVSAAAYAAAYYFKGTELRINKVDAVDIDQTTNLVRGSSWLTLFSPQNRDYDLGFAPVAPDAEPSADPVVAMDGSRSANVEVLSSWFGPPESSSAGGIGFGGYQYEPISEPEELRGVRVNIWSTKSFSGRWTGSINAPLLESDLTPDGPDRLRGTVTNVGRRPMKGVAVFFGRYVYPLPDIAPGASVSLGEAQALAAYLDGLDRGSGRNAVSYNYYNGQPRSAVPAATGDEASGERPDLVRSMMFHGGNGARGAEMPNLALRSLDLSGQLELRRPMVVAQVEGPAAKLRLGGNGSVPKMTQTTIVRVILPLKTDPAAGAARP
jgi:hypothetical protein